MRINQRFSTSQKVLKSVNIPGVTEFSYTQPDEIVLPQFIGTELSFHGIRSRLGTTTAVVSIADTDVETLAEEEVRNFVDESVSQNTIESMIQDMKVAVDTVLRDISDLPIGTVIIQTGLPQEGNQWYKVFPIVDNDWSKTFSSSDPVMDYDYTRNQIFDIHEGPTPGLSNEDMNMSWNTDNFSIPIDVNHKEKEIETLNDPTRNNLQFGL